MTIGGQALGGQSRIDLLNAIATEGSITKAAKAVSLSYKAAWDAIDTMNNLAGEPLVERLVGGKGGGSTRLTARGQQLVSHYQRIAVAHQQFLAELDQQASGMGDDFALLKRLNMKTSARNQFYGTVMQVQKGAVNDEIQIQLAGGQVLIATVTSESTTALGLATGTEVIALVKSSSIILIEANTQIGFSARNRLTGEIVRLQTGAINTEVVLALPGGGTLAAMVTNESSQQLGLAVGQTITAIFKASSVIVGVTG